MSMKALIFILLLLVGTPSIAYAGDWCYYNGRAYPLGTVIGPFVCTGSGWQRR